jgi:hypothetical protein
VSMGRNNAQSKYIADMDGLAGPTTRETDDDIDRLLPAWSNQIFSLARPLDDVVPTRRAAYLWHEKHF